MNVSEQIEYFAERHARGELTEEDIAELTILCQAPDFARDFVLALADYEEWRRATRPVENPEKFVQAVLKRSGISSSTPNFSASVTRAARQRVHEIPSRRMAPNPGRRDNTLAWLISLAACVALAFLIYLTSASNRSTPAAQVDQPQNQTIDAAKIEEQRQKAQHELAEVEANRIRAQQRLEEIERRRADLIKSTAPNTAANERQNALDQIEAERRKVDAELAAMREARRQAEANVRVTEEAQAKAKAGQGTAEIKTAQTPAPQPTPTPSMAAKVENDAIARIDEVNGDVWVVKGDKRRKAEPGKSLIQSEGLETYIGANIKISFLDGTSLKIGSSTLINELVSNTAEGTAYPKTVALKKGSLIADVTPQPSERPMVLRTDQAEILVVGTKFTVSTSKESTWLDMQSGKVNFRNRKTGNAVPVSGGQTAVMEPDKDAVVSKKPVFMKGVNFGGKAVTVEGESWIGQQDAQAKGLSFSAEPKLAKANVAPAWSPEADMADMLTSAIYVKDASLAIKQAVPQGRYEVYFWVLEPQADYSRSFEIQMEGQSVQQNVGARLQRGEWQKLGPYAVTVNDGTLDITLVKSKGEPCLMGMAIFRHEE